MSQKSSQLLTNWTMSKSHKTSNNISIVLVKTVTEKNNDCIICLDSGSRISPLTRWKYESGMTERGSALLVTILLTSVMVIFGITLLDRIISYSREVRSVEDAVQASYEARGQVELGKSAFSLQPNRNDIDTSLVRITQATPWVIELKMPWSNSEYVIISRSTILPLYIRKYPQDANAFRFGNSLSNNNQHTLTSQWSVSFDLSQFPATSSTSLDIKIDSPPSAFPIPLKIEFIHEDTTWSTVTSFLWTITATNSLTSLLVAVDIADISKKLSDFLSSNDCSTAKSCTLKLSIDSPIFQKTDFTLESTENISDLNAVLIADGFSGNRLYHQRVVELIPMVQGF